MNRCVWRVLRVLRLVPPPFPERTQVLLPLDPTDRAEEGRGDCFDALLRAAPAARPSSARSRSAPRPSPGTLAGGLGGLLALALVEGVGSTEGRGVMRENRKCAGEERAKRRRRRCGTGCEQQASQPAPGGASVAGAAVAGAGSSSHRALVALAAAEASGVAAGVDGLLSTRATQRQ